MTKDLSMTSTKDIGFVLSAVANRLNSEEPLKPEDIEKLNLMLRLAKHSVQTIAIMLAAAKMRGLKGKQISQLAHFKAGQND